MPFLMVDTQPNVTGTLERPTKVTMSPRQLADFNATAAVAPSQTLADDIHVLPPGPIDPALSGWYSLLQDGAENAVFDTVAILSNFVVGTSPPRSDALAGSIILNASPPMGIVSIQSADVWPGPPAFPNGDSGSVEMFSGQTKDGNSGLAGVYTGNTLGAGNAGSVDILAGNGGVGGGTGKGGDVNISAGAGNLSGGLGAPGQVQIFGGAGKSAGGDIFITSGSADAGRGGSTTLLTGPGSPSGSVNVTTGGGAQFTDSTGNHSVQTGSVNNSPGVSGSIFLRTGNSNADARTGDVFLTTGNGSVGPSNTGGITLATGSTKTTGSSGILSIATGTVVDQQSGSASMLTGNASGIGGSGGMTVGTGTTKSAGSGSVTVRSGATTGGNSGQVQISTGFVNGLGTAGAISIASGGSNTGNGGNITLTPGTSTSGKSGQLVFANILNFADDAAAAAGGIVIGGVYRSPTQGLQARAV